MQPFHVHCHCFHWSLWWSAMCTREAPTRPGGTYPSFPLVKVITMDSMSPWMEVHDRHHFPWFPCSCLTASKYVMSTADRLEWFETALQILERGSPIDLEIPWSGWTRQFYNVHRQRWCWVFKISQVNICRGTFTWLPFDQILFKYSTYHFLEFWRIRILCWYQGWINIAGSDFYGDGSGGNEKRHLDFRCNCGQSYAVKKRAWTCKTHWQIIFVAAAKGAFRRPAIRENWNEEERCRFGHQALGPNSNGSPVFRAQSRSCRRTAQTGLGSVGGAMRHALAPGGHAEAHTFSHARSKHV